MRDCLSSVICQAITHVSIFGNIFLLFIKIHNYG